MSQFDGGVAVVNAAGQVALLCQSRVWLWHERIKIEGLYVWRG